RSGPRIERGPRATGDRLVGERAVLRQLVRNVVVIGDRGIDSIAVERGPPLHPTLIAAWPDERIPDERAGLRVEHGVDAALSAEADDVAHVRLDLLPVAIVVGLPVAIDVHPHHVRARAAEIPFLAVGFSGAPGDGGWHCAARAQPGRVALRA